MTKYRNQIFDQKIDLNVWANYNDKWFLHYSTTQHKVKKITDHPGFEPGTLALLAQCSTNWANVSDGEERYTSNAYVPGLNPGWSVIFSLNVIYIVW